MESVQPEEEKQAEFSVKTSEGPTDSLIGPYRCLTDEEHRAIEAAWKPTSGGWYGNRPKPKGRPRLDFGNSPVRADRLSGAAAERPGRSQHQPKEWAAK